MVDACELACLPERLGYCQHPLAVVRVEPDLLPFSSSQRSWLGPDPIWHRYTAQVVDLPGSTEIGDFLLGETESAAGGSRQLGHTP